MEVATRMSARRNNANEAGIEMHQLFGEGAFKLVYKGTYRKGERTGEACVGKVFKDGAKYDESFFRHELDIVDKALDIVEKYNNGKYIVDRTITLNCPDIWTFLPGTAYAGQKALVEPMITNFEKFNSNSGWHASDTPWHLVMQSLSHFSYHATGGSFLLCDLQGGVYSNGVVLTDPVVMSRTQQFGPTDLGATGTSTFFSNHVCNQYCSHTWTSPADKRAYFKVKKGTSMMVPTCVKREPMSCMYE